MDLDDIEWGDVVGDADGVLEVEGRLGDIDVLVRRYRDPEARGVIEAVRLLAERGETAPDVLGYGDDWICLERPDPFEGILGP